jgi:hypothetical protein
VEGPALTATSKDRKMVMAVIASEVEALDAREVLLV